MGQWHIIKSIHFKLHNTQDCIFLTITSHSSFFHFLFNWHLQLLNCFKQITSLPAGHKKSLIYSKTFLDKHLKDNVNK